MTVCEGCLDQKRPNAALVKNFVRGSARLMCTPASLMVRDMLASCDPG